MPNKKYYSFSLSKDGKLEIKDNKKTVFSGKITLTSSIWEKDKKPEKRCTRFILSKKGQEYTIRLNEKSTVSLNVEIKKGLFEIKHNAAGYIIVLKGKFNLRNGISGFVQPKPQNNSVFFMSSGRPCTDIFDAAYFSEDDLAVEFISSGREIAPLEGNTQIILSDPRKIGIRLLNDYYKRKNPRYKLFDKKRFPTAPAGWLSYYCYFESPSEEEMLKNLEFLEKHFKRYGLEYLVIEAWQRNAYLPVRNFYHSLEVDKKKFPNGMKYMADRIHEKGLKAGIWIVPFGTGEKKFFEKNRDMFIIGKNGRPLMSWCGRYTLDITFPKAQKYIFNMLKEVSEKWGYDYFKIDGLELPGKGDNYLDSFYRQKGVKELLHNRKIDPLLTSVKLTRSAIGKNRFFLACAASLGDEDRCVGTVNGARIGFDPFTSGKNPNWQTIIHQAKATAATYYAHNIFWYNDPDILAVRDPLSLKEAHAYATIIGITGQVLFVSDILYRLSPEKIYMLQRIMPVCDTYPAQLYKMENVRNIWNLIIKRDFEQWNVAALFNWGKESASASPPDFGENDEKEICLNAEAIGLSKDKKYILYDFWDDKFLGRLEKEKIFRIKRHSCLLLGIREEKPHPQILSVNRHITQGGVCLREVSWSDSENCLRGISDVPGNEQYILTIHTPECYRLKLVACDKDRISGESICRNIVKITIQSFQNDRISWKILFQ